MNLRAFRARLVRLEKAHKGDNHTFYMPDGTKKLMSSTRAQKALQDAFDGLDTPDTRIVMTCVGQGDGEGRCAELIQALRSDED